jgi:hypothetical protein
MCGFWDINCIFGSACPVHFGCWGMVNIETIFSKLRFEKDLHSPRTLNNCSRDRTKERMRKKNGQVQFCYFFCVKDENILTKRKTETK